MKQKKWILPAVIFLAIATSMVITFLIYNNQPQNRFPNWEEHRETKVNPNVTITFDRIESNVFISYGRNFKDESFDEIHVIIDNRTEESIYFGLWYWVEYFNEKDQKWHLVYLPDVVLGTFSSIKSGITNRGYTLRSKTWATPGTYRLYLEDLGYCEFTIE